MLLVMVFMQFFAFEGTDGSTKSTQLDLLLKRLDDYGIEYKTIKFPFYESESSLRVRQYLGRERDLNGDLVFGDPTKRNAKMASTFYIDDRWYHRDKMKKWLDDGYIVIADRYAGSNRGHQGAKVKDPVEREEFLKWLDHEEYVVRKNPKEDMNIWLKMPPVIASELADDRGSNDGHENIGYITASYHAYEFVAKREGWQIIECAEPGADKPKPKEEIHELIWNAIEKNLPEKIRFTLGI